jgi:hypothetical protein
MKINIPIWGLVNKNGELVYWADDRKNCMENKWESDEKLIPLQMTERKKK